MNAIISLCHFCDLHGPRTLFCTQAFKYSDQTHHCQQQQQQHQQSNQQTSDSLLMEANTSVTLSTLNQTNEPIVVTQTQAPTSSKLSFSPESCSSSQLPTTSGLNQSRRQSVQFNTNKRPLTSQSTSSQSSLFSTLDSASLTCRACRAFEKNFHHYISYDETTGDSTSNICYISQSTPSDSEVFALVRKACLRTLHCEVFEDPIYFDDDKDGSVIGYEFHIKDSEGRGQQRSYSLLIIMKDRMYLQHLWSFLSKQISIIATNLKQEAQQKFDKEVKENPLVNLNQINTQMNRQCTNTNKRQSNRGLIELTDDPIIFAKLHMWFTWILRMSACQISEEFIHGPVPEDIQVKIEREKLSRLSLNDDDKTDDENHINKDANLSDLIFESDTDNCLVNFQVDTLRNIIEFIGKEKFHELAYNLIIGNQVIIQGKLENLISSIIKVFEELIPVGCCQSICYSNKYIKSYECKLLGLSDKCLIQTNVSNEACSLVDDDLNDYVYLNIDLVSKDLNDSSLQLNQLDFSSAFKLIKEKYYINLTSKTNVAIKIEQTPSVLTRMENYLFNSSLNDVSVSSLIKLVKEEWLNKTKVFHKFLKSPSVKNSFEIETVLKMLKLDKNDELALRFWQAGLSDECKIQIRTF